MIDEIDLAARYSIVPNSFGYCGSRDFASIFRDYRNKTATKKDMVAALKKFNGLYSYLKTIACANKKNPFHRKVIEAFWIGNSLLKNVKVSDIKNLILGDLCKKAGMDKARATTAATNLPGGISLHHNFNSLYLHFVGDKVARTTKNFDKCRIGWGEVISLSKKHCVLKYRPIKKNDYGYFLDKPVKRRFNRSVCGILLEQNLTPGDVVSTHWGAIVQRLNKLELSNLISSNRGTLISVNSTV